MDGARQMRQGKGPRAPIRLRAEVLVVHDPELHRRQVEAISNLLLSLASGLGVSHRPSACPHQTDPEIEAAICELRREHPGWGPRRIEHVHAKTLRVMRCLPRSRSHRRG